MKVVHGPVSGVRSGRIDRGINTQSYCYRFGNALIDTGPPAGWRTVRTFVEAEHARRPIEQIVLTHHHEDHAGNAARLQEMLGCPVYAPADSLERLRKGYPQELYRRFVWGKPSAVTASPLSDTLDVGSGEQLSVIPAPGHADDMVCLFERSRGWLFSADLFLTRRPLYLRFDEDLSALIDSLRALRARPIDTLFCGHAGLVPEGARALKSKLHYLVALCARAQAMRAEGKPADATRADLLGREGLLYYVSTGDFSKQHLIEAGLQVDLHVPEGASTDDG